MAVIREVLCYIGEELFGIDINYVKGIEKYRNISPIPSAPDYIEGIINLRGDVIPIYNLRHKFNLPDVSPTENTKLIISKSNDMLVAFMVDMVSEIVEIEEEEFQEVPEIVMTDETSYIHAIAQVKDRLVVLLNLEAMVSRKESKQMKAILNE